MYTEGLNPCAFKALLYDADLFFLFCFFVFFMDRTVENGM